MLLTRCRDQSRSVAGSLKDLITLHYNATRHIRHDLAAHARMSRRNFTRRFAEATGTTPARWVLARRLDEARRLLETTAWPVTRIAAACGFTSVVTFRQNFTATYATTPTSYRQRFSASST